MKQFEFDALPEDMQDFVFEIPNLEIDNGKAEFKVLTNPDPEWGNIHVPLALHLVKCGARKGEVVLITGIR